MVAAMTSHAEIDTDLAIDLRKKGEPWHAVARQCGSTAYLVRKALSVAGFRWWKRYQDGPKLLTAHKLAKVKRLKEAGATWKELGRIMGVDPVKLERYVKRH
jgi:hypothetical protein